MKDLLPGIISSIIVGRTIWTSPFDSSPGQYAGIRVGLLEPYAYDVTAIVVALNINNKTGLAIGLIPFFLCPF